LSRKLEKAGNRGARAKAHAPQRADCQSVAGFQPALHLSHLTFFLAALAVVAAVYAAYSPTLNYPFILDDHQFLGDPRMQSPGHVGEYFTSWVWAQFAGGPVSFYRPLFLLWLRVNFILFEMSPWGWHLLSILKHIAAAILLGLLTWKLLRGRVAALMAAALFALHPAATESVAWITVPDPLASAAIVGALLLYFRYEGRRSVAWLIASALVYLAALFAKETAIVFLAVLLPLALTLRPAEGARAFRDTVPFLAATAAYLALRVHALGGRLVPLTQHLPWRTVLLSWPATIWFYVKVLLWPVRSRAFADPIRADQFSVRGVLLPGVAVVCVLAILGWALVRCWRKEAAGVKAALLVGTLLLVLPLLPALNLNALNPEDSLHGRYAYLSANGLMLLLATGWHLAQRRRAFWLGASGLLAIAFLALTVSQEAAWKDDLAVFTEGHRNAPRNVFVDRNLVRAHVEEALGWDVAGRCQQALPVFEDAIRRHPEDWYGWAGLGDCLDQLNELPRAEQALHRAADLAHLDRVTERWREVREKCRTGCQPAADWQSAPRSTTETLPAR